MDMFGDRCWLGMMTLSRMSSATEVLNRDCRGCVPRTWDNLERILRDGYAEVTP